ncbi:MAG: HAMP domain-containing histidine kinase [Clostridia bacterium]|nr:HAMP domain-containing histidine kinase [Clostridia bacterium]
MRIVRNREVRREAALHLVLTALLAGAGFFVSPAAGGLLLFAGILFTAVHGVFLWRRYRDIARLAEELDEILYGKAGSLIAESEEGELAVLRSEIAKLTRRLREQADDLAAEKGRLADAIADIFHQIRTPLTSIHLALSMIGEEETPKEENARLIREVTRGLDKIRFLTESLLTLSRIDAGKLTFRREKTGVRKLLEKAAEPHRIAMELREQEFRLEAGEETVFCDPVWTAEAISNLIRNAVEHTPPGGRIRAEAAETALYVSVTVTDSGPGFREEEIPRLFERFFRGQDAAPGSIGIGLALCREILANQDGVVTAENAPEGGARFTVRFYKSTI